jgi:hypothetical protein
MHTETRHDAAVPLASDRPLLHLRTPLAAIGDFTWVSRAPDSAATCLGESGDAIQATGSTVRRSLMLLVSGFVALAAPARAQTTADGGASLLIFPKVVASSSGDTLLQVANLLDARVDVFCTYVDGASWNATGFRLSLVAEQPLHWPASQGRAATGEDDPNDIPAAPADFAGELICVEVDGTGAPSAGNRLVGRATVAPLPDGDALAYAAIGVPSSGFNDGDDTLCLGDETTDACLFGAEYNACPAAWWLAHPSDGAPDEQLGAGATQATRLVIVPCSQNIRDGEPGHVEVALEVTNEFEQHFAATASVDCWADLAAGEVSDIFRADMLGSAAAATHLAAANGSGGFVVLAERERRAAGGAVVARDALVPQQDGAGAGSDAITLPMVRR